MRCVFERGEGLCGCIAPGGSPSATPMPARSCRGERDRRAACPDRAVRADRSRPGHAGDTGAACGRLRPVRDGSGVDVTAEGEHEPRLLAEGGDRGFDGVRAGAFARRRRRSCHAITDVGCHCRRIAANVRAGESVVQAIAAAGEPETRGGPRPLHSYGTKTLRRTRGSRHRARRARCRGRRGPTVRRLGAPCCLSLALPYDPDSPTTASPAASSASTRRFAT